MLELVLNLLFPKRCIGCSSVGSYLCAICIQHIIQGELVCPHCYKSAIGGQTHPLCHKKYGLDGLWSLGLYQSVLRDAIIQFKYKYVKEIGSLLTDILIEYWARHQPFLLERIKRDQGKDWLIIPIPLHNYRYNWRGFNQSELLARKLADSFGLRIAAPLQRTRLTKPQVKLKGVTRRGNLKNAFTLDNNYRVIATNIILIDDVWTTGSTMRECCYILKRAGAKTVWALTAAR